MKKLFRIFIVLLIAVFTIVLVWTALVLHLFSGSDTSEPERVYSPDGSKVIIPIINHNKENYDTYLLVSLDIQETRTNKTVFQIRTRASDRMQWSVTWVDNSMVRLDSSDIGSYCWKDIGDQWIVVECE